MGLTWGEISPLHDIRLGTMLSLKVPSGGCADRWEAEVSEVATVLVGGDEFNAMPEHPFVFGRADADGVVGLDANDMGISATAGSVEWIWGLWWLVNYSRKRRLLLDDGTGDNPSAWNAGNGSPSTFAD